MLKKLTACGMAVLFGYAIILSGCTTPPPRNHNDICAIFKQYPSWYWETVKVRKKWYVPISTQMAIIYQESGFHATAKPARKKILWIIPWKRPTTSYGYSQATDGAWKHYKNKSGNTDADRATFDDAADFIGWYANLAHQKLGISLANTRDVYLAYHEGLGGYVSGSYLRKPWLIAIANKVNARTELYQYQLSKCEKSLPKKPWWRFW